MLFHSTNHSCYFIAVVFFRVVSGVVLLVLHSGSKLLSMDADGYSDPYCILTANRQKVYLVYCKPLSKLVSQMLT